MSPEEARSLTARLLRPVGEYFANPLHGCGLALSFCLIFAATATAASPFGEWFNLPLVGWTGVGVFAATIVNQMVWSVRHRRQLTVAARTREITQRRAELTRLEAEMEAETQARLEALVA